jgi:hypothetical protein
MFQDERKFKLCQIYFEVSRLKRASASGSLRPAIQRYLATVTETRHTDQILVAHTPDAICHVAARKQVLQVGGNESVGVEVTVRSYGARGRGPHKGRHSQLPAREHRHSHAPRERHRRHQADSGDGGAGPI